MGQSLKQLVLFEPIIYYIKLQRPFACEYGCACGVRACACMSVRFELITAHSSKPQYELMTHRILTTASHR